MIPSFCRPPSRVGLAPRCHLHSQGFTLVELLVVIAMMGILMAMVGPSLPSLLGAKAIGKAGVTASGALERARAEAMSRRTYIYVGFLNSTNNDGNSELRIGMVESLDGTSSTAQSNLKALGRVLPIENMRLTNLGGLPPTVQERAEGLVAADFLSDFSTRINFSVGKQSFAEAPTLIFSPQGELLPSAPSFTFLPAVHIGLVPTRKTTPLTNGKDGAIVTYRGASGHIQIVRP